MIVISLKIGIGICAKFVVVFAAIDKAEWPEVVGTISGDDTLFIATDTAAAQSRARARSRSTGFSQKMALPAAAARNGWAGVVVDGCVRDVAELALCQTGIRALAAMPLPTEKRNEGQRDVAVQIQGVWVRPGEWLYADEDGVVVSSTALHA